LGRRTPPVEPEVVPGSTCDPSPCEHPPRAITEKPRPANAVQATIRKRNFNTRNTPYTRANAHYRGKSSLRSSRWSYAARVSGTFRREGSARRIRTRHLVENVNELLRLPSPAPRPQSLAFDGELLWLGSLETRRIYSIDPATWSAHDETEAPGLPWGMTVAGDELFVIYGVGSDDDRLVQPYIPGRGFAGEPVRAPDGTGSQLGWDGDVLYISQWYNKRILGIDATGNVLSTIDVPHGICGQVVAEGCFYLVTTDEEETGPYWLTRVDARGGNAPVCEDLAIVPFPARALAFDGTRFWSNHRAANEIVAFARP
jgi:hypothetical protein